MLLVEKRKFVLTERFLGQISKSAALFAIRYNVRRKQAHLPSSDST